MGRGLAMEKQSEISKNSSIETDGFTRSRNKTLYIICPCYNEEENLEGGTCFKATME